MVTRALTAGALVALVALAGCTHVLGIEDARIDPTLNGGHTGGAGGASGSTSVTSTSASTTTGTGGGTTGTGGGGGRIDGDAAIDAPAQAPDGADGGSAVCAQYCEDIMMFCTGNIGQYIDVRQCMKVCALFPQGVVGGSDGNTSACRMKYAGKARYAAGSERDAYCRKAGPGSDGTCGAICEGFCTIMMPTCTASRTSPYYYPSTDACLTDCRGLHDNPPYTVADGTLPDTNDAQCRLFHSNSAVMDPDEHCEHAMGITMCDSKSDAGGDR
jgi:hypothetical protein